MTPTTTDPTGALNWQAGTVAETAERLGVDLEVGLGRAEVEVRRARFGPNRIVGAPAPPRWKKFVGQFRSGIVLILIAAAAIAGLVGDLKDTVVIAVVLVINATLGYLQEARAETALAGLERMLVASARVRREGRLIEVPTDRLVPGDVVLLEPGDRVPADGRLVLAVGLALDESSLTGESGPVSKSAGPMAGAGAATSLGDRHNMAFLNTTVTRGRGELVVTGTGMSTEMGKVAGLLAEADPGPTPLERELDRLTARLAAIACGAVALVFLLEVARGVAVGDAAVGAVALAVAAIPEGLPAVVTVTLAVGVRQMAEHRAIVRRLHSVETLGSTTVICSDKTGTLTLNRMAVRAVVRGGHRVDLDVAGDATPGSLGAALDVAVLCSDAALNDGELVGDPTEGALLALAARSGLEAGALRRSRPRVGEVPFDSTSKFMATFHAAGDGIVCLAKGAPDRLVPRCGSMATDTGVPVVLDDALRAELGAANEALAAEGLRVLALASRTLPRSAVTFGPDGAVVDPEQFVADMTLEALVGIADPARPEAGEAISRCHGAGIDVKMITGDHAATAAAVAASLGLGGEVVSGDDLDAMDDAELAARIDSIGVCARVSPTHKVRVVRALQANGHVAAMTGDGVNDAAALRTADIGLAMGITGTEVTKEAADMVLADDNFSTIVEAVERGRAIYANIVKFVQFQLSTNLGAIGTILGAGLIGLPVPFSPVQVLWVNLIADGPPAMTLGVDPPDDRAMTVGPRPAGASILSSRRIGRLLWFAAVMTVGTLGLLGVSRARWGEQVALTMTFTTFVLFQMFNVFNARTGRESVFSRQLLANRRLLFAVAAVVGSQFLAVTWGPLQGLFGTQDLTLVQTSICVSVASTVLWLEEIRKVAMRWLDRSRVRPS